MSTIANLIVKLSANTTQFVSEMDKASRQFDKDAKKWENLGGNLTSAGSALSIGVSAPLIALAAVSATTAANLEALTMGLESVSGSSEATQAKLSELKEVAKLPGLGFEQAIQGQVRLQAAGLSAELATTALQSFGNAIAVVGGGKAELDGVTLALSQIASKGKVSAEEINQLAERVPQIRQAMIAAFGTGDTKLLQSQGIGVEEFVTKVSAELAKIPPVTGGLKNSFENISDSATRAFGAIGDAIAPAIQAVVPLIEQLVGWIEQGAKWFAELPVPVQSFALGLTALAVVVGPLLLGLGSLITAVTTVGAAVAPIAAVLGVSVTALAGWAAAIAVATGALVALGVWVYQNWEPIKATVMQAWDGISELWTAYWNTIGTAIETQWNNLIGLVDLIFGPAAKWLGGIWANLVSIWKNNWDTITSVLSAVWLGIVDVASTAWDAVIGAISGAMDWMRKNIPGMEKLLTLDKAWDGASKLKEVHEKVESQIKKTATAADGAVPKFARFTSGVTSATTESKAAEKQQKALEDQIEATRKAIEKQRDELDKLATALTKQKEYNDLADAAGNLNDKLLAQQTAMATISGTSIPDVVSGLVNAVPEVTAFADEFGVVAASAETELGNVNTSLSGWASGASSYATDFKTNFTDKIIGGIQGIGNDAIKGLLTGEFSLSKIGASFKQLGFDAVALFTKPLMDAITGPNGVINAAIKPLSDALGGIVSQFLNIGGSAGSSIPIGGGGGGGGSTGGGAGGIGGADPFSVVTGILQLGSSIWGNFQNLEIETGIDKVEENTRYTKIWTGERTDSIMQTLWKIQEDIQVMRGPTQNMAADIETLKPLPSLLALEQGSTIGWWLKQISGFGAQNLIQQGNIFTWTKELLEQIRDRGAGGITLNITVNPNNLSQPITTVQTIPLNTLIAYGISPA